MRNFLAYGIAQARLQAAFSKDPSTKVGAAILRPDGTLASAGRNGFPIGVHDSPERLADREWKLDATIHAEENAMLLAREALHGYTMFVWPLPPCAPCAARIIQSGIVRVVYDLAEGEEDVPERWCRSMARARDLLSERGVLIDRYRFVEGDPQPFA